MYYLVNGYRFITPQKNLKIHKMDEDKNVFSKTSEKQILAVALQNYAKNQLQKTL